MTRPKHRTRPGNAYFVTTNTWQRREIFRTSNAAAILQHKLFSYRDQGAYALHAFVIMPDYLHVISMPGNTTSLEKAIQLIKGGSSHEIGKEMNFRFPVWQPGFTEHLIRDDPDFEGHVRYIEDNPVQASLVIEPTEYEFCSSRCSELLDPWPMASAAKAAINGASTRRG